MWRAISLSLGMMALSAGAAAAQPACQLGKIAEMPVRMEGARPLVTVEVNGRPVTLLMDTGAFFSALDRPAAAKLGIRLEPLPTGLSVSGAGGEAEFKLGRAQNFKVAGSSFTSVEFLVGGPSAGVTDGLLGQNLLGRVDVEYDLANGVIRLFKLDGCKNANLAYWAAGKPVQQLRLDARSPLQPHLVTTVKVNGRNVKALLDTGASTTIVKQSFAERVGFDLADPKVTEGGVSRGVGRGGFETYVAPFESVEIGGEQIKNTRLRVADIQLGQDLVLGADFFLSHRIFVSNSLNTMFFTHNGGPVFRLRDSATAAELAEREKLPDAMAYSRRAAASAARRDFAGAVADLDEAIKLAPDEPAHLYDRAMLRVRSRQPDLAIRDLDATLKLNPNHTRALVARGHAHLSKQDPVLAKADFDEARRRSAEDYDVRLQIAGAFERAGHFSEAVAEYDAWIAAHPEDPHLADFLNARCWSRGLWNRELDKALEDCNRAIRRSRDSYVVDSRGLIYLRMGDYPRALKDYDDAIRLQPRSAWSLYGRGLTKLKMGREAEGQADLAAAKALAPELAEEAAKYGLTP